MIKVIRTTESYSFIGSWNRFMVSGYFAWGKQDSQRDESNTLGTKNRGSIIRDDRKAH